VERITHNVLRRFGVSRSASAGDGAA
jgi:hypothetical protein